MNSKKGTRDARAGFSILELLIVLVILVAILAIVGPRLLRSQQKADIKLTQIQISSLESALKEYAVDMKSFPDSEEGLKALIQKPVDERKARRWSGPYLEEKEIPWDPWDNEYVYQFDPAETGQDRPAITSKGPDGELNTEDDIFNFRPGESDEGSENEEGESLDSVNLGDELEN